MSVAPTFKLQKNDIRQKNNGFIIAGKKQWDAAQHQQGLDLTICRYLH